MKKDIQIAQEATMLPIKDVAATIGIKEHDLALYGKYKAKISDELINRTKKNPDGKLILVTAINPTPAGEGKTTTSAVSYTHLLLQLQCFRFQKEEVQQQDKASAGSWPCG